MEKRKRALKASVFPTCVTTLFCPEIVDAALSVLAAAGVDADLRGAYSCCGQPAYSAGHLREARRVATSALASLATTTDPIVVPSGSCTAMIRKAWPRLFRQGAKNKMANDVARRTFEFTEFLDPLEIPFSEEPPRKKEVTYHDSCHGLRELGLQKQGRILLERAGYRIVECENSQLCCGFGGVFSQILPEVAFSIGAEKAAALMRAAPVATGGDAACLIHLSESLHLSGSGKTATRSSERRGEKGGFVGSSHNSGSEASTDGTQRRAEEISGSFKHIAQLLEDRLGRPA